MYLYTDASKGIQLSPCVPGDMQQFCLSRLASEHLCLPLSQFWMISPLAVWGRLSCCREHYKKTEDWTSRVRLWVHSGLCSLLNWVQRIVRFRQMTSKFHVKFSWDTERNCAKSPRLQNSRDYRKTVCLYSLGMKSRYSSGRNNKEGQTRRKCV